MIGLERSGIYIQWYTTQPLKKNEMPFAATWMESETLILSEVSQKEKDKYHMILIILNLNSLKPLVSGSHTGQQQSS